MEVYLIRHAESTNQALDDQDERVFDPPLTELGERQAILLAKFFRNGEERVLYSDRAIDRLFSSPMWRAMQTTRPLSDALDLVPTVWVDVHEQVQATEVHAGSRRSTIQAGFPDFQLSEAITEEGWWNRASEPRTECMERAIRVAEWLWERGGADENIAIVSHARFLDSLLKAFLHQLPADNIWYHHFNTGISRLGLGGDRLDIRYLNRVDHLPSTKVS